MFKVQPEAAAVELLNNQLFTLKIKHFQRNWYHKDIQATIDISIHCVIKVTVLQTLLIQDEATSHYKLLLTNHFC